MEFTFTAIDAAGGQVAEQIRSDSESQAIQRLQSQGYIILSLQAAGSKARRVKREKNEEKNGEISAASSQGTGLNRSIPLPWKRKLKLDQLTLLTREFAIMIETGVPIVEAVELLREHADNPILQDALVGVYTDLCEGKTLVQALSAHPNVFPKLYVDMVRTAEVGGNLALALEQGAEYLEISLAMRRKVKGAMTYPVVLLGVACIVLVFVLTYLIPQFSDMFTRMNVALPPTTQFLIMLSGVMRAHFWVVFAAPVALVTGWRRLMRVPAAKLASTRFFHRVPVLGDTMKKVAMARILRALGTLMECGVPLMIVLETVEEVSGDMVFAQAMRAIRQKVEGGTPLSDAVISTKAFSPMVCQMMVVGEKSGRLSSILNRVALYFEREVDARLSSLTSILEPIMIIVLGFLVGFIAVSIITPIYSLVSGVK